MCANFLAVRFVAMVASVRGLVASYQLDLPMSATIVYGLGAAALLARFRKQA